MKKIFPKLKYSLKSTKQIDLLFHDGKSFNSYPLRILYAVEKEADGNFKILISVPKKRFRLAVERNLVKRRIREALRINITNLDGIVLKEKVFLKIAIIYTSSEIVDYFNIEEKVIHSLNKLSSLIYDNKPQH